MAGEKKALNDKDVANLLSRFKNAEVKYPADLLSKRRARFISGAAALKGGSIHAGSGAGHAGMHPTALTLMDKVIIAIELAVLTSLTAYLAAAAYANRDYLKHLLFPSTPTAVQAVQPPYFSGSAEPTVSSILTGTPTPTGTLESTPVPAGEGATPQIVQPTNPGLHLGQTKNPPQSTPGH